MVGVAGKSKGCNTCRKRKIRCDQTRPTCIQCEKSKRICEGYERERVFRNTFRDHGEEEEPTTSITLQAWPSLALDNSSIQRYSESSSSSSGSLSTRSWSPINLDNCPDVHDEWRDTHQRLKPHTSRIKDLSEEKTSGSTNNSVSALWPEVSNLSSMPLFSLPNVISSRKLFLQYMLLERLLPADSLASGFMDKPPIVGSWFLDIPLLADASSALSNGTTALGALLVWQTSKEKYLLKESLNSYGRALLALQKILANDRQRLSDETLAATLLLAAYESTLSHKAIGGWISHVTGACYLVQLRGPKAHRRGLAHELFLNCRHMAMNQALGSRRATFFADPVWCTIPWSAGRPKTAYHTLCDTLLKISGIIERSLNLRLTDLVILPQSFEYEAHKAKVANTIENSAEIEAFLNDAWDVINSLEAWKINYELSFEGPLYTICPATFPFSKGVFLTSFDFPSFVTAQCLTQMWSGSILICSTIMQSYAILEIPQPQFEIIQWALNICSSMEYLLQPRNKLSGIKITGLPIRVALETFTITKMNKEKLWCLEVYDLMARMGFPFLRAVASYSWADWRQAPTTGGAIGEHDFDD